jgi:molybdenum cofactor cytidylyltransferase
MDEPRHVAIVLAAGGSRRLGRAKQLLTRDGEPLVRRALRLAATTRPRRLLLVLGAAHEAVRAAAGEGVGFEAVVNPEWEQGLGSSLRRAWSALQDETAACLILGCDQPALEAGHLQALVDVARTQASGCAATRYDDALGMPALVAPRMMREVAALHGDRGLRDALNREARDAIGRVEAATPATDLDTRADVDAAVARGWLDRD